MLFLFRIGNKLSFAFISILEVILFAACSNESNTELEIFKALDENLNNSNLTINKSTETILRELNAKTTDPASAAKANIWYPKALNIQQKSKTVFSYLEELKLALKKEAGVDEAKNSVNGENKTSVARVFKKMGKGKELYDSLTKFKQDLFAIDRIFQPAFESTMILISNSFENSPDGKEEFTDAFFKNISAAGALTLLSKFQNSIKIYENRFIQFCNNKVADFGHHYTTFSIIVGQSSNIVKVGDEIEITAGMGEFNRSGKPIINFDGHQIDINEYGTAVYKFKTSLKSGKYMLPVEISYIDQEGRQHYITKTVEYTVVK